MPLIVTVVLSMGVKDMAKNHAIMKNLFAIETSSSANVVLSDKTGTLTQNKMTVTEIFTNNKRFERDQIITTNKELEKLLFLSLLNNNTVINKTNLNIYEFLGDPTEVALSQVAVNIGLNPISIIENNKRIYEIPFNSTTKIMTTVHHNKDKGIIAIIKGAPENIINISSFIESNNNIYPLSNEYKKLLLKQNEYFSEKALRVISIGYKTLDVNIDNSNNCNKNCNLIKNYFDNYESLESDITFVGLLAMIDPPKVEAKETIETLHMAGIKTCMITGDSKITATAIAKELNISTDISQSITGIEIDSLSKEDFYKCIEKYNVFARVSPEHKLKIVEAFQANNNVVIMTGDGVNDAPALKKADIGVAMGKYGTEVAKEAADMILGDDNFSTISYAIKYGRQAYENNFLAMVLVCQYYFMDLQLV